MTKFENVGAERQYDSQTKAEANRNFHHSCELCCNRGMHLECDRCQIRVAHELTVGILDDIEREKIFGFYPKTIFA